MVIDADPAPTEEVDSKNLAGSLLVKVTTNPPSGATPFSVTLALISRPWPTVTLAGTNPAGFTATVSVFAPDAGILKPAGEAAVTVVLPALMALNWVIAV